VPTVWRRTGTGRAVAQARSERAEQARVAGEFTHVHGALWEAVARPTGMPRAPGRRWRSYCCTGPAKGCLIGDPRHCPRLRAAIVDGFTFGGDIIETDTDSYRLAHTKTNYPSVAPRDLRYDFG